jgi:hypothetical protein
MIGLVIFLPDAGARVNLTGKISSGDNGNPLVANEDTHVS